MDTPLRLALHLPDAARAAAAPDWVQLVPVGPGGIVARRDGRGPYRLEDPAAVIAESLARSDGRLPIDENHALDRAAPEGLPSPARGWIVALEMRESGLWGRVEWTEEGRRLVEGRAYRALSPALLHDGAGRILAVLRASLVNLPNLRGIAALNQERHMTLAERLAELLGIAPPEGGGAPDEEAILAAVARLKEAAALHDARAPVVEALQAEVTALADRLARLVAERRRAEAEAFVDGEIARGRAVVSALREHYIARHMENPDAVRREIAAMPLLGATSAQAAPPAAAARVALNAEEAWVAAALRISPQDFAAARAALAREETV